MSTSSVRVIVTASPDEALCQCAVTGHDAVDARGLTGRHDDDRIAAPYLAGSHGSRIAAEIMVGPIDPLHRKAERLGLRALIDLDILQIVQQGRAAIPRRIGGRPGDVVAEAGGDRDRHDRHESELGRERGIVADDSIEGLLGVADKVDLVHGEDDVTNAEQRADEGMSPGLHQDALAGIDQDDGELRIGCAGRHVAGILLVPGRVGDHERAVGRGEEAIGDVDRDALLALGLQAVDQQREIDVVAGGAVALGILGERRQLILEDELGIVQQPPDQRGLAVVDRAAGDEAQEIPVGIAVADAVLIALPRLVCRHGIHQKYPSRFFFSIEAVSSVSMRRPCRSETRAVSISATMSAIEAASDSMAPDSG